MTCSVQVAFIHESYLSPQELLEGVFRLQGLLSEEVPVAVDSEGDEPAPEAGHVDADSVLANTYKTYQSLILHTCAALRSAPLALPALLQMRIYKLLFSGLCIPQREQLLRSRLVRDKADMALQALVDAQRNGKPTSVRHPRKLSCTPQARLVWQGTAISAPPKTQHTKKALPKR